MITEKRPESDDVHGTAQSSLLALRRETIERLFAHLLSPWGPIPSLDSRKRALQLVPSGKPLQVVTRIREIGYNNPHCKDWVWKQSELPGAGFNLASPTAHSTRPIVDSTEVSPLQVMAL